MASVGTASLDIVVDKQRLGSEITGAVSGQKAGVFSAAKGLAAAVGGGFAAVKTFDFFKDSIKEAQEAAKVQRQTNAVLESTKGAAGIGASGIGDLANKLSGLAGIDDELIQSGENVLLTFTNIKNGVGKNNNIFDQATEAAVNMSSALGTDLQGSIIQVGKALNDPIKGVSALSRVGVSFTQQQKDQIKTLVDSGKTMDAQKIILKELGTEFGGAAAAAADPMARLSVVWGNLKETLGGALLPIITAVATFFADKLPGAIEKTKKFVAPLAADIRSFFNTLKTGFTEDEGTGIERFALLLRNKVFPVIKTVAAWLKNNWQTALKIAGAAFLFFTGPITFVVLTLTLLYVKFKAVREGVAAFASFITGTVIPVVQKVAGFIIDQFGKAVDWFRSIWPQVSEAVSHVMNVVRDIITVVVNVVSALWRAWGDDLLRIVKTIWNFIQETIENALQVVKGIIKVVLAVINGDWGKAWDAIKQIVGGVWDQIGNVISTAFGVLRGLFDGFVSTIQQVWSELWSGLAGVVDSVWVGIQNTIRGGINTVIDAVDLLIKAYNLLPGHKDIGLVPHLPDVNHHAGGHVTEFRGTNGGRADGGPVVEGTYLVGERGPELLKMGRGSSGYVLSNAELNAIRAGGSSGSSRGGLHVHVYNAVVGNVHQVGLQLTEIITEHLENGGAKPPWATT